MSWRAKNLWSPRLVWIAGLSLVAGWIHGEDLGAWNPVQTPPTDYAFRAWQTTDGLPQNSVTALVQTSDGYLWVGTRAGLARFNGVEFNVYNSRSSPGLPHDTIAGLFEDHDGNLIISTWGGGLAVMRGGRIEELRHTQFANDAVVALLLTRDADSLLLGRLGTVFRWAGGQLVPLTPERGFQPIVASSFCQDEHGTVWAVEEHRNLLQLQDDRLVRVDLEGPLAGASCSSLVKDAEGALWLGTSKGLAVYRDNRFELVELPPTEGSPEVTNLLPGRGGGLWVQRAFMIQLLKEGRWVGSLLDLAPKVKTWARLLAEDQWGRACLGGRAEGLLRVPVEGQYLTLDRQGGLPGNSVNCFLTDREGNEWLGLDDGGLVRLRPRRFRALEGLEQGESAPFLSVCEDHEGDIWAGSSLGGLYRLREGQVALYARDNTLPLTQIWSVYEDSRSNLWVGTSWLGLFRYQSEGFVNVLNREAVPGKITAIYEGADGVLWIGCSFAVIRLQDGEAETYMIPGTGPNGDVTSLVEDRQGRLWIGTASRGLLCMTRGLFSTYTRADGLPHDSIWSLYLDDEGWLWIGTRGGGLSCLREGEFVSISTRMGLVADIICHITEDQEGWFWFSTPHGVFRVERDSLKAVVRGEAGRIRCVSYGISEGMPSEECSGGSQPSGWRTRDGRLLFPTLKGVAVVRPESFPINNVIPPVVVERVIVEGETLEEDQWRDAHPQEGVRERISAVRPGRRTAEDRVILRPDDYRLEIAYAALSLAAPEKVRFRHRLEGLESQWVEVGGARSAFYTRLSPGRFVFHVQACNNDGLWNEEGASLAILVQPYFWQTMWFKVLSAGLLAVGLGLMIRGMVHRKARLHMMRFQQLEAVQTERNRIARDIHDAVGASLTRISIMSELAHTDRWHPEAVEEHVQSIARAARETVQALDEIVWTVNPRNDTLHSLLQYLSHYAFEFFQNTDIACRLDLPEDTPALSISSELRHHLFMIVKEGLNNVLKHSQATRAQISVTLRDRLLTLRIQDNGRGMDLTAPLPVGRRNGLGNMRQRIEAIGGRFNLESLPGRGTAIEIQLQCPANH